MCSLGDKRTIESSSIPECVGEEKAERSKPVVTKHEAVGTNNTVCSAAGAKARPLVGIRSLALLAKEREPNFLLRQRRNISQSRITRKKRDELQDDRIGIGSAEHRVDTTRTDTREREKRYV